MLKATGLMLVFSSIALYGFYRAQLLVERTNMLRLMITYWQQFSMQLDCLRCSPKEIALLLAHQETFRQFSFASSFAEGFQKERNFRLALAYSLKECPDFNRWGVADTLNPLCDAIGLRDLDAQQLALDSTLLLLTQLISVAEEEQKKYGSLYQRLGILCGLLVTVTLL